MTRNSVTHPVAAAASHRGCDDWDTPSSRRPGGAAEDFWDNRFHACALAGGFLAAAAGRIEDSAFVRAIVYSLFDYGRLPPPVNDAAAIDGRHRSHP